MQRYRHTKVLHPINGKKLNTGAEEEEMDVGDQR